MPKVLLPIAFIALFTACTETQDSAEDVSVNKDLTYEIIQETPIKGNCKSDEIALNEEVYTALESNGDLLHLPRDIHHYFYFKTIKDRDNFMAAHVTEGYEIVDLSYYEDDHTYSLHITDSMAIDKELIDDICIQFCLQAQSFHGEYDGWECSLRTE